MSLFSSIFGKSERPIELPPLGRYSDAYKTPAHYERWDMAEASFRSGDFKTSVKYLLDFIVNPAGDNLEVLDEESMSFALIQGSKRVVAYIQDDLFRAEVNMAEIKEIESICLQQLLEHNYNLQYCRFSINDKNLVRIIFDSALVDLTPHKFYYALRELAIVADKTDDLLLKDYHSLRAVDNHHITHLSKNEQSVKLRFWQDQLTQLLSADIQDDHARMYHILDFVYRMDYFLLPQGKFMDTFEQIHNLYFNMSFGSSASKNDRAMELLKDLSLSPEEELRSELYGVTHSFGIVKPVDAETIITLFQGEQKNLRWYHEKDDEQTVLAILGYLMGFSLFSYAPPKPMKDLFDLFFRIRDEAYLRDLTNTPNRLVTKKGEIDFKTVDEELKRIEQESRNHYPDLYFNLKKTEGPQLWDLAYEWSALVLNADWTER